MLRGPLIRTGFLLRYALASVPVSSRFTAAICPPNEGAGALEASTSGDTAL